MSYAVFAYFFGLGLEDGQVPTLWSLLQSVGAFFIHGSHKGKGPTLQAESDQVGDPGLKVCTM